MKNGRKISDPEDLQKHVYFRGAFFMNIANPASGFSKNLLNASVA